MNGELMTAGRFASATLLSAKALRLYAERELLPPRVVDPVDGYRYFGADQVRTGWLIALLRSAELSLDMIASVVGASAAGRWAQRGDWRRPSLSTEPAHVRETAGCVD